MQLLKVNDLIRVGRNFDGGYVISESLLMQSDVLLSFGINDDWSFEEDFVNKTEVPCYGFDFSIHKSIFYKRGIEQLKFFFGDLFKRKKIDFKRFVKAKNYFLLHRNFNSFFSKNFFLAYGIDNKTHGIFKNLEDILTEYLNNKKNIFLKVDIEGYEFKIIDDIIKLNHMFNGLAMEIHNIHNKRNEFDNLIEKIESKYYIYHLHANNYGSIQKENQFPDAIEISCIRKDLVAEPSFYNDFSHLPITNLDFINNPDAADFVW